MIAQEVEKVFPEMVATDERGYKAVNYSQLPLMLLGAVRELKAEVATLREQVEQLNRQQAAIQRLEVEIERLSSMEKARPAALEAAIR